MFTRGLATRKPCPAAPVSALFIRMLETPTRPAGIFKKPAKAGWLNHASSCAVSSSPRSGATAKQIALQQRAHREEENARETNGSLGIRCDDSIRSLASFGTAGRRTDLDAEERRDQADGQ